jgi:class 3 adenylate cyclase/tetratricopeptide (TPR) repeat protein
MTATIERKIVSLLFCDLVGFTSLSESIDPEDVSTIQEAYFAKVRETVTRFGGQLEKFIGDAAVAVFGVPIARDDDAERAVRAGLGVANAVEQLNGIFRLDETTLAVRVGVNTGEVALRVGADSTEGRVTGDPVNVAARFQAAADPGTVLIGETTALAVADAVELEPLGALALKGKAEPVRAWRAVSIRQERSRDAAMGDLRAPIVGRDAELAWLEEALQNELARVVIVAPPGVGKTRIVTELGARASARGVACLSARLRSEVVGLFQPVAQLLQGALRHAGVDVGADKDSDQARDLIVRRLEGTGSGSVAAGRAADAVLDTVWPVDGHGGPNLVEEILFSAWIDALDALVADFGAVWIVEDVHWAGPDFLAFLSEAGRSRPPNGRWVVCTARPSLLETAAPWCREPSVELLHLSPLSPLDSAHLIRSLVGAALPDTLVERIVQCSSGNALFIEEILRMWISVGTLVRSNGSWQLAREPDAPTLPATVQAIYAAQLDDLPMPARMVARRASVAGPRFPLGSLEALGIPDAAVGVEVLVQRSILSGPHHMGEFNEIYAFRHALLQETAYASLARSERSRFHVRLARWFEQLSSAGRAEIAETIAAHYAAAVKEAPALALEVDDGLDKATAARLGAECFVKAAEQGAGAHHASQALLTRARELVGDGVPETVAKIELGHALLSFVQGDGPGSLEHAEAALHIGETVGAREIVVAALMDMAWVQCGHDTDRALELIDRALTFPEADRYAPIYKAPRTLRGIVQMYRGALDDARNELLGQVAVGRERRDNSTGNIRLHLSELEYRAGRWGEGLRHAIEHMQIAEEQAEIQNVSAALYARALHEAVLGEVDAARAHATRGLEIDRELGDEVFSAQNAWVLGLLELSLGNADAALEHLAPLPEIAARIGVTDPNSWLLFEPDLIEALVQEGRLGEAEDLTSGLEERARRSGLARGLSVSHRCRALLELAKGRLDAALEAAVAALGVPGIDAQPFEVARALNVKGSIQRATGATDKACGTLREAVAMFDWLGAGVWSERAKTELRELAGS